MTDGPQLPEAIPVLSYERQTDTGAIVWAVRFVGIWTMCAGLATLVGGLIQAGQYVVGGSVYSMLPLSLLVAIVGGAGHAILGWAIFNLRRYGVWGAGALVATSTLIGIVIMCLQGTAVLMLAIVPQSLIPAVAQMGLLVSLGRRAEARGILRPARVPRRAVSDHKNDITFLVSRIGWIFIAQGGIVLVSFAMLPLLRSAGVTTSGWATWQTAVTVALYAAVAVCGVLMRFGQVPAIWALVVLLLPQAIGPQLIRLWQPSYAFTGAFWRQALWLIPALVGNLSYTVLLCILARKAMRSGTDSPPTP